MVEAPDSRTVRSSLETIPVWRKRLRTCNADKAAVRMWIEQQETEDASANEPAP